MKDGILRTDKNENIILIWATNSGKSFFIKKQVIPFLEEKWIKIIYFENCDELDSTKKADIFIVDEVELLFDKAFLEKNHPEETPYYTKSYLEKVKRWHNKLSQINTKIIWIVTRNDEKDIDYVLQNYKELEWNNLPVEVVKFARDKIILTGQSPRTTGSVYTYFRTLD